MFIDQNSPLLLDWSELQSDRTAGVNGYAIIKTRETAGLRLRQVEYSAAYEADHWCEKGHLIHVLQGELLLEYSNGSTQNICEGMTCVLGDNAAAHKAKSFAGAVVLIVD
jgi:quercetin dioxygenase-like cupin family protein